MDRGQAHPRPVQVVEPRWCDMTKELQCVSGVEWSTRSCVLVSPRVQISGLSGLSEASTKNQEISLHFDAPTSAQYALFACPELPQHAFAPFAGARGLWCSHVQISMAWPCRHFSADCTFCNPASTSPEPQDVCA